MILGVWLPAVNTLNQILNLQRGLYIGAVSLVRPVSPGPARCVTSIHLRILRHQHTAAAAVVMMMYL